MKCKVLVDIKVVCTPLNIVGPQARTLEERAKCLEKWCREFEDFVRDHRSQDPISLTVEREYRDECSYCTYEWETDAEGFPLCCGKAQKEWEEQKPEVTT